MPLPDGERLAAAWSDTNRDRSLLQQLRRHHSGEPLWRVGSLGARARRPSHLTSEEDDSGQNSNADDRNSPGAAELDLSVHLILRRQPLLPEAVESLPEQSDAELVGLHHEKLVSNPD